MKNTHNYMNNNKCRRHKHLEIIKSSTLTVASRANMGLQNKAKKNTTDQKNQKETCSAYKETTCSTMSVFDKKNQ